MAKDSSSKTPQSSDNYKISGRGISPDEVESSLIRGRKSLVSKLEKAGVSSEISLVKTDVSARYEIKKGVDPTKYGVRDTTIVGDSISAIQGNASRLLIEVEVYDSSFQVDEYYALSASQRKAIEAKTPTADGVSPRSSSLSSLSDSLRI